MFTFVETKKLFTMINRVGERFITNEKLSFEIVEYHCHTNCTIKFEDGVLLHNVAYSAIKKGQVKNPFYKSVYKVGYVGVGKHKVSSKGEHFRVYRVWNGLLQRCYKEDYPKKTYVGCSTVNEWHNFQNFAEWYDLNYDSSFMVDWHLDKDILIRGNKIYGPDTCCFVPREINALFIKGEKLRGDLPIGVFKIGKKFGACLSIGKGVSKHLGSFKTIEEAFQAYKIAKENYIKEVAEKYKGQISEPCYKALYDYEVKITD